jgi:hypothetical protein
VECGKIYTLGADLLFWSLWHLLFNNLSLLPFSLTTVASLVPKDCCLILKRVDLELLYPISLKNLNVVFHGKHHLADTSSLS